MYGCKFLSHGFLVLLCALVAVGKVSAHGWVSMPGSRQEMCLTRVQGPQYCGGTQYEPQSVEAMKGAPFKREVGEAICNGGGLRFDELNTAVRRPRTTVVPTSDIDVEWTIMHPEATTKFYYYATKTDWDYSKITRLTKEDFEAEPILVVEGEGEMPPTQILHAIKAGAFGKRVGYTILLAVWETADTSSSFYNCIDLNLAKDPKLSVQWEA